MSKYSQPFAQYFVEAPLASITASSLSVMLQAWHTYFWAVSPILCKTSQAPPGWMGIVGAQPDMFNQVWLDHSRTFRVDLKPLLFHLRPRALWSRFIKDVSVHCCTHLSLDPDQYPSSCCWKTSPEHDAATTMLHCRDGIGQVMSGAWFPPDMTLGIQAK